MIDVYGFFSLPKRVGSGQEVCSGRPSPIPDQGIRKACSGQGWDQDGPGWPPLQDLDGSNVFLGTLRTWDGTLMDPGSDPGKGLDGTPRRVV